MTGRLFRVKTAVFGGGRARVDFWRADSELNSGLIGSLFPFVQAIFGTCSLFSLSRLGSESGSLDSTFKHISYLLKFSGRRIRRIQNSNGADPPNRKQFIQLLNALKPFQSFKIDAFNIKSARDLLCRPLGERARMFGGVDDDRWVGVSGSNGTAQASASEQSGKRERASREGVEPRVAKERGGETSDGAGVGVDLCIVDAGVDSANGGAGDSAGAARGDMRRTFVDADVAADALWICEESEVGGVEVKTRVWRWTRASRRRGTTLRGHRKEKVLVSGGVHPYLAGFLPVSVVQPWLVSECKELIVPLREIPPEYPFANSTLNPATNMHHIPYLELHGTGSPISLDIGIEGDVYLDLTPGKYALWGRTAQGWKRWVDHVGNITEEPFAQPWSVKHPFLDCYLWLGTTLEGKQYIGWLPRNELSFASISRTRRWALSLGLPIEMPNCDSGNDSQIAYREAAVMLSRMNHLSEQNSLQLDKQDSETQPPSPNMKAIEKPEHPCYRSPKPRSHLQPQITVKCRGFIITTLPPSYPFCSRPTNGNHKIPFFEFSALGPPAINLDVGGEGDIYLDRTPGAYALYAKTNSGWKRWVDTGGSLGSGAQWPTADWIIRHPHIETHALWVSFGGVNFKNLESDPGDRPGFAGWYKVGTAKSTRTIAYKLGILQKNMTMRNGEMLTNKERWQRESCRVLEGTINGTQASGGQDSREKLPTKREASLAFKLKRPSKKARWEDARELSEFAIEF
ncbi:hypothetical protein R3P38DRAFT_3525495 [Favolaschia claudopus]|uniref:Uncharacterized protein n=1 Tax=Favolaschia claudopus TaxID=2862362 RepID=A0AAW0BID4_9AGAR